MTNLLCAICLISLMEHGTRTRTIENLRRHGMDSRQILGCICNAP